MPASPLYSIPSPSVWTLWRSHVTGPPGWIWTPLTSPTSVKKKSPSYYKRSSERSKLWTESLEIPKLNHSLSVDSERDEKMPELVKKPETLETLKMPETVDKYHVEKKPESVLDTAESNEEPYGVIDSLLNNLKDKPSQTLNWTKPEYDTIYIDTPPSK